MGEKRKRSLLHFMSGGFVRDWVYDVSEPFLEKQRERHWREKARSGGFADEFDRALIAWKTRGADYASHRAFLEACPDDYMNQSAFLVRLQGYFDKKSAMLSLALAGAGVAILTGNWGELLPGSSHLLAPSILVGLCASWRWLRLTESDLNWAAAMRALRTFDVIYGGRSWSGKDATVVATERATPRSVPGPVGLALICRTHSGVWFVFEVRVHFGKALSREVRALPDEEARWMLERHQRAYHKWFGVPPAV